MFYTSGNWEVNNRAGVTLVNFDTGCMIQMTGHAAVDWHFNGEYKGTTWLIKLQLEKHVRTNHVTNHRWKLLDYSPYNPSVAGKDDSDGKSDFTTIVTLVKIVTESRNVKTF